MKSEETMKAKVFKSGNSMAIRIPNEITLEAKEYDIVELGDNGFCLKPIPAEETE